MLTFWRQKLSEDEASLTPAVVFRWKQSLYLQTGLRRLDRRQILKVARATRLVLFLTEVLGLDQLVTHHEWRGG